MLVMGVDGAPNGWVGAVWDWQQLRLLYRTSLSQLFLDAGQPSVVAVDMPIGLVESGLRRAETTAREFLGARRSSIFLSPVRAVFARGNFTDFAGANQHSREVTGSGLSRQSFALFRKIDEVERWRHTVTATVVEVHPEVTFQVMAQGPLTASKKTWRGMCERRRLLAAGGLEPNEVDDCGPAAPDDVLDAIATAWTAWRVASDSARSFPADPLPGEPTIWA